MPLYGSSFNVYVCSWARGPAGVRVYAAPGRSRSSSCVPHASGLHMIFTYIKFAVVNVHGEIELILEICMHI